MFSLCGLSLLSLELVVLFLVFEGFLWFYLMVFVVA